MFVFAESLIDNSLFENTEDPTSQACNEFRYQMQHACDRIKSSKRRQSGSVSRKRFVRQKLTVPLKVEVQNDLDEAGAFDEEAE